MTLQSDTPVTGFIGRIPVRNIWLLLLYASQLYRELPASRRVELEEAPDDIPDLVAEILANAVERRLRRNLTAGYQRRQADLNRVRGRINLLRTERRQLLQRARVACVFDELTTDTPRNRYVRAALTHVAGVVRGPHLQHRCRDLALRMEMAGVTGYMDSNQARKTAPLANAGWVDSHERQMLAAAQLALNLHIPTEQAGRSLLPLADRRERRGWELYEDAVAGFYKVVLTEWGWRVRAQSGITWPIENPTPGLPVMMPGMTRDMVMEHRNRRIIIDTKFTSIVTAGQYGNETFKSGNIYQLYAYLRTQENCDDPPSLHSTGVLLYPSLGADYDESTNIQSHRIRFATVDLAADSKTIREQLLRIVPGALPDATS